LYAGGPGGVGRAVIMADGPRVSAEDLGLEAASSTGQEGLNLRQAREEAEKRAIRNALALCEQRIAQAADMLDVSRQTLYDFMEKYALK
jgi:two-component system NtrC family response regulator